MFTYKNSRKTQTTLIVVITLFACFLITGTVTAQSPPPFSGDFDGTPPADWNGNMSRPSDFNGSNGFGDGGMPQDFNGTMPFTSGSPGEMNGQQNPQSVDNQTNYTLIAIGGVVVVAVVVAASAMMLIRKKKKQAIPTVPVQLP